MSPSGALFVTILFILFVFKVDFKKETKISYALWIPLIWLMRSVSKPFSFWFDPTTPITSTEMDMVEGDPIDRTIFIILILLSLIVLFRRKIEWKMFFKNNRWIIIWFFYCGISIFWSDFPVISIKRWIKEIGFFLGVLVVLTEKEPNEAVNTLLKRYSYILIPISIMLIYYFPTIGMSFAIDTGIMSYVGVAFGKNGLGAICFISIYIFFYNIILARKESHISIFNKHIMIYILYGLVSFILLIKVNSSTSLAAAIIGIGFLTLMRRKFVKNNLKLISIFSIGILLSGIILQYTFDIKEIFIESLGRDPTLTGRTLLWKDLLHVPNNPYIGVGYGSFWLGKRLAIIWETQIWKPMQTHNGYLDVYLELGAIGLSLMMIIIYKSYKKLKEDLIIDYDYGIFQFGILIFILLYNITEASFGNISPMWFIYLLVLVDTSKISKNSFLKQENKNISVSHRRN